MGTHNGDLFFKDDWFGPPWRVPEAVLLIHGVAESSRAWYGWVPHLARKYRVIRPDLPGFGESGAEAGRSWTTAAYAKDLADLLERLGLDAVHVIGAKIGGSIALQFAADFPQRTRSLQVFSGPARVRGAASPLDVASFAERIRKGGVRKWADETQRARLGATASAPQVAWWTDELMGKSKAESNIGITAAVAELDIFPILPRIKARTLIVTTDGSQLQPVEAVRAYQQEIPNSKLLVLPSDSYHIAAAEPEKCANIALDFLTELGAGTTRPATGPAPSSRPPAVVKLRDGGHIAYDAHNFTPPWTTPDPVVLVHGFSKNRHYWFDWIPALASRYRVFNVDQRGHGDSSMPPRDFTMSLSLFSDDLAAFLDGIGIESAHFIMAEFTSSVAIELAASHPGRVKSLVLPGFGYAWKNAPVDWSAWTAMAENEGSERWARETNKYRLPADADPALREWYVTQQARVPGWVLGRVFRYSSTLDLTPRLKDVHPPTLVLAGTESKQDTIESVRKAVGAMPRAQLVELQGAPFNVMTARPQECIAATLAFLDQQSPKKTA